MSFLTTNNSRMMEPLPGFPEDIFAVVWHDKRTTDDWHAAHEPEERDRIAGPHDVRLLARYAKPHRDGDTIVHLDDLTRGMGQWKDFSRIAIVTDEPSIRHAVQFFGPFFHGPIRVFPNARGADARAWLSERH